MLFNENHSNHSSSIDRTNYEEYFLLYMDGELTAAQKVDVEQFVANNSDLRAELELLLSTKVSPEAVDLDKEELLSASMQLNEMDEVLVLYMDNELPKEDKHAVEHTIRTHKDFQLHYQLLQKAKLPVEKIVFPYKKELYQRSATAYPAYMWLRIAAMILVILSVALLLWRQPAHLPQTISLAQPKAKPVQENKVAKELLKEPLHTAPVATIMHKVTDVPTAAKTIAIVKKPTAKKHIVKGTSPILPVPETNRDMAITTNQKSIETPIPQDAAPSQKISNHLAVTSPIPDTYTTKEASPTTAVLKDAVADNSSKEKKPLKSFFRQATRFIERTTNINPANEDGELLIGAVSVKLK